MNEQINKTIVSERRFPMSFDRHAFQEMVDNLGEHDLPIVAHWTGETIVGKVHLTDSIERDWAEGHCSGFVNGYFKIDIQHAHMELYDSPLKSFKLDIDCDPLPNQRIRLSARLDVKAQNGTYRSSPRVILYEG